MALTLRASTRGRVWLRLGVMLVLAGAGFGLAQQWAPPPQYLCAYPGRPHRPPVPPAWASIFPPTVRSLPEVSWGQPEAGTALFAPQPGKGPAATLQMRVIQWTSHFDADDPTTRLATALASRREQMMACYLPSPFSDDAGPAVGETWTDAVQVALNGHGTVSWVGARLTRESRARRDCLQEVVAGTRAVDVAPWADAAHLDDELALAELVFEVAHVDGPYSRPTGGASLKVLREQERTNVWRERQRARAQAALRRLGRGQRASGHPPAAWMGLRSR